MNKQLVFLVACLLLATQILSVSATETEEYFEILIYGDFSWLFVLSFLGVCFLITKFVKPFALFGTIGCIFMAFDYGLQVPNTGHVWKIIALGVGSIVLLAHLFDYDLFKW